MAQHVAQSLTFAKEAKDISREEEQRGTEKVFFWGAAIALVLFVSLVTIALVGRAWSVSTVGLDRRVRGLGGFWGECGLLYPMSRSHPPFVVSIAGRATMH
ncbi:hypothetical protein [Mesorhizobium sp. M0768]|uniref:hypothetical protein n=1 Tax=unclassified Mesorhizobium TaxID=325217 RepID=UPI003336969A